MRHEWNIRAITSRGLVILGVLALGACLQTPTPIPPGCCDGTSDSPADLLDDTGGDPAPDTPTHDAPADTSADMPEDMAYDPEPDSDIGDISGDEAGDVEDEEIEEDAGDAEGDGDGGEVT